MNRQLNTNICESHVTLCAVGSNSVNRYKGRALTRVLLATGNRDKQGEFRQLLADLPFDPVTPQQAGASASPEETGDTHEAIARDKAARWSRAASMLAIASDGGLVIPRPWAAVGEPLHPPLRWPRGQRRPTVGAAAGTDAPASGRRPAGFMAEALAIADRGRVLASWELTGGEGLIDERRAGTGPVPEFWVFPVWRFPRLGKTYDQLTPAQRASIDDHWARLRQLVSRYFTSLYVPAP